MHCGRLHHSVCYQQLCTDSTNYLLVSCARDRVLDRMDLWTNLIWTKGMLAVILSVQTKDFALLPPVKTIL